jgi:2-polyprenyl-3-methyl-5-hydroxy-6-metoxy-1,4-benzoquinol methylase
MKPSGGGSEMVEIADSDKVAFVRYYQTNNIMPVSQHVDNPRFFQARDFLYSALGIPLRALTGRTILEFGPGGGYNAIATAMHKPFTFVFVDAVELSVQQIKTRRDAGLYNCDKIEVHQKNIFDFSDERTFDFVIIEGVIPGQTKPQEMLSHASSFVGDNGVLIFTTVDEFSILSEVCRRMFRPLLVGISNDRRIQCEYAEKIFSSHLRTLGRNTRPIRDWVLDNIFHVLEPEANFLFSIKNAIETLNDEFRFYHSFPRFFVDGRFYKSAVECADITNSLVVEQYEKTAPSFLDCRMPIGDVGLSYETTRELSRLCKTLYKLQVEANLENSYRVLPEFLDTLSGVAALLPTSLNATILSMTEFVDIFPKVIESRAPRGDEFTHFSQWWGRGQQYLSFTRYAA